MLHSLIIGMNASYSVDFITVMSVIVFWVELPPWYTYPVLLVSLFFYAQACFAWAGGVAISAQDCGATFNYTLYFVSVTAITTLALLIGSSLMNSAEYETFRRTEELKQSNTRLRAAYFGLLERNQLVHVQNTQLLHQNESLRATSSSIDDFSKHMLPSFSQSDELLVERVFNERPELLTAWRISLHDVKVVRRMALTSRSDVFEGSLGRRAVCIKRLTNLEFEENVIRFLREEIVLMTQLSHPHIVRFLGTCVELPYICIITEWMQLGSLFELLRAREPCQIGFDPPGGCQCIQCQRSIRDGDIFVDLPRLESTPRFSSDEDSLPIAFAACMREGSLGGTSSSSAGTRTLNWRQKLRMTLDAARGMSYLHSSKPTIIHRDLKTLNLLVTANLRVKVADFGLSQQGLVTSAFVNSANIMGTPAYIAPELILGKPFNERVDVYSFGIVLWEMHTHAMPFSGLADATILFQTVSQQARPPLDVNPRVPEPIAQLAAQCWAQTPSERPSFKHVLKTLRSIADAFH